MKKCAKGHYYADELDHCPYCPPGTDAVSISGADNGSVADKTQVFGGSGDKSGDKTNVFAGQGGDKTERQPADVPDSERTIISIPDDKTGEVVKRAKKKLVGWLVSYTIDEMGIDFRLYEGKNLIGSNPGCNITVLNDRSVSGEHATILFRGGVFMIKDEFSTNGTFVNDKMLINDTPTLVDGDIIKTGDTVFKFKSAL